MKKHLQSQAPAETRKIAARLAKNLKAGDVIALSGELGSGKTVFSQALARELGVRKNVTSASFVIVQKFEGGRLPFYHLDFYRLSGTEIMETEFEEILDEPAVVVIEWAERAAGSLPEKSIRVDLKFISDEGRQLEISGPASKLKGL
jgi:tRNA threonylcarbamoyladenosine biosynthesis protein TsaE